MDRREQVPPQEHMRPRSRAERGRPGEDHKTVGLAASASEPQKRFLVIRNGRGILAHGDDMKELERNYRAAEEGAPDAPRGERGGWLVYTWPAFASLARCDHEGATGKVCIVDAVDAPDAATSYYGMGFVH